MDLPDEVRGEHESLDDLVSDYYRIRRDHALLRIAYARLFMKYDQLATQYESTVLTRERSKQDGGRH